MPTTTVLYVPITTQTQPLSAIFGELKGFLDPESLNTFHTLFSNRLIRESTRGISQVEEVLIDGEDKIPFMEISEIIEENGLIPLSVSSCLHFLYALKGVKNKEIRRSFFRSGGITLLSTEPILLRGELQYLVIGQDSISERKEDQRLFSVRLLPALKMFPCKLYRVIAARV